MRGTPASLPFAATLAHVFNHGTHHRGQITAALTALGQPCPELDLVYMLQQEGFIVTAFERGLPALDAVHLQVPDLAILDVGLPDISGFELCRRLLARHPALDD